MQAIPASRRAFDARTIDLGLVYRQNCRLGSVLWWVSHQDDLEALISVENVRENDNNQLIPTDPIKYAGPMRTTGVACGVACEAHAIGRTRHVCAIVVVQVRKMRHCR